MAMLPADELNSLKQTAHLLRSPGNAVRLLNALARSRQEPGTAYDSIEALSAAIEGGA
jgi:antitoxin YefM